MIIERPCVLAALSSKLTNDADNLILWYTRYFSAQAGEYAFTSL